MFRRYVNSYGCDPAALTPPPLPVAGEVIYFDCSNPFVVVPNVTSALALVQQPGSLSAGGELLRQPRLQLQVPIYMYIYIYLNVFIYKYIYVCIYVYVQMDR